MINTKQTSELTVHPLAAMGIQSACESLFVLPKEYVDLRRPHVKLSLMPFDDKLRFFEAEIVSKVALGKDRLPTRSPYPASLTLVFQFKDGLRAEVRIVGKTSEWLQIQIHDRLSFISRLSSGFQGCLKFKTIELMSATGRAKAVYAGISGKIAGAVIERAAFEAASNPMYVRDAAKLINENRFVSKLIRGNGYPSIETLLFDLHRPLTPESGIRALETARMVCIEEVRSFSRIANRGGDAELLNIDVALTKRAKEQPEKISPGQGHALNVIRRTIKTQKAARILCNGDVGSGKTLVFMLVAASIADHGRRSVILVPSELVARQIYAQCKTRFPELCPALITAGYAPPTAEARILVGTQALLNAEGLGEIGLLIVDEQHKFSVAQRTALADGNTHIIEASATPIPRSLALALFDGWTEATIVGMPMEKRIHSHLYIKTERAPIVNAVNAAIGRGEKVVFLYASVGNGESSCVKAAERLSAHFVDKVGLVHGKMKAAAKEAVMNDFKSGARPVLVASSVIEVGVDVPNITVFVVNQADRFGVAQLHQLRGRLVRNGGVGDFFMLTDKKASKDTLERLVAVRNTCDGFKLAERDLEIRGFGEILGETQSGATETFFKLPRLTPADFVRK